MGVEVVLRVHIKLIIIVFLLMSTVACEANNNKKKELISMLQTSFEGITSVKFSKIFPHMERSLNACIQSRDKLCLMVYHRFKQGKSTILSLPADQALDATLDIIEKACVSVNDLTTQDHCYGGLMSLYFYNTPELDAKILARIKKYPKKIKNVIFNYDFYWYCNRPNVNVWIDYTSTVDVEWKPNKLKKQVILDIFRKTIDEFENEPWVLR